MISKENFHEELDTMFDKEKWQVWEKKLKTDKIVKITLGIIFGILILTTLILTRLISIMFLVAFAVMVCIVTITYAIYHKVHKNAFEKIKDESIGKILGVLLKNYKYYYSHYSHLNEYIYCVSPFATSRYDHFSGEDFLQVFIPNDDGTPSNVPMILSDLNVTREEHYTDSDGNHHTRTVTVYNGTLAKIDFPFEFKCSLSINCQVANTKKITTEDITFNKHFKTYSDNEIEAFLILTPALINKLKALGVKAGDFEIVLRGDSLYFSFDRKNILELNPKEKPKNIFDRIYNDIDMILSIVDEIKNNNKVFKM